jgi:hypothetical protein
MTFQAYIDTNKAKTGLSPSDFQKRADAKGFLNGGPKTVNYVSEQVSTMSLGGQQARPWRDSVGAQPPLHLPIKKLPMDGRLLSLLKCFRSGRLSMSLRAGLPERLLAESLAGWFVPSPEVLPELPGLVLSLCCSA